MADSLAITKGTLDVIVLRALSWTPMHGVEIAEWLEERASRSIDFTDAAVYQSLYRMEQRGLVEATWGLTENNRRARYYALTPAGAAHLRTESRKWVRYAETVAELLSAAPTARSARSSKKT
jgi:transcriptional regulator